MQHTRIILSLVVSSLIIPIGTAAPWVVEGTTEPDNALDTPDFMWQDAPGAAEGRVYFAVMSFSRTTAGGVNVNPNVGALGTHNEAPSSEFHEAVLGVWVDCNGDDYIGMAEGALREYPTTLLLDDSLCPPISGTPNSWPAGAHNYRQLVTEFIPISDDPEDLDGDKRLYIDEDVRVWGDFGRWDARPTQRSCTLSPQARGTYQSTGGTLNWIDCRVDILGTWNVVESDLGLGMRFADADDAEGSFADMETFGSEDAGHASVTVVDCGAEPLVDTAATANETGIAQPVDDVIDQAEGASGLTIGDAWELYGAKVTALAPGLTGAEDPNVPGQLNQSNEELRGDCDTTNDRGNDFYRGTCGTTPVLCVGEADFNGVDPNRKTEADWNFGFSPTARGGLPFSALGAIGGSGTSGYDTFGGAVGPSQPGAGTGGARWYSDSLWLSKPGPALVKADAESGTIGLADAYWLQFYAYVGPATSGRFALPGGGATGFYGSWHCGDATSGNHNGWICDRDAWYVNPDGTLVSGRDGFAQPGDLYNLRDADCYDGKVGALGVGIYPASYGDAPCV